METKNPKTLREFTVTYSEDDGKTSEKNYILKQPTSKALREARWKYSAVYSKAVKEGLLTERQMTELLTSENNENEDNEVSLLASMYVDAGVLQQQLNEEEDFDKKRKLAEKLRDLREEIYEEEASLRSPYNNTAEQRAEEARLEHLLIYMTYNKDGSRVWETEDDYESEMNLNLIEIAKTHLIYWMNDLPEDWEENLPEMKVIREGLKKDIEEAKKMAEEVAKPKKETKKSSKKPSKEKSTTRNKRKSTKKKTTKKKSANSQPTQTSA